MKFRKSINLLIIFLILTIFSSFCSVCKTGNRVRTLIKLKNKFIGEKFDGKIKIAFSEPFEREDIDKLNNYIKIPFDNIYICPEILPEEQKYITKDNFKNDPLTIVISKNEIIFVEKNRNE